MLVMAALFQLVHADAPMLDGGIAVLDTRGKDKSWRHRSAFHPERAVFIVAGFQFAVPNRARVCTAE
jgi:hypothetical protein